jgi:hypothetical protein
VEPEANRLVGQIMPGLNHNGIAIMASCFADSHQDCGIVGNRTDILCGSNQAFPVHRSEQRWGKAGTKEFVFVRIGQIRERHNVDRPHSPSKVGSWELRERSPAKHLNDDHEKQAGYDDKQSNNHHFETMNGNIPSL